MVPDILLKEKNNNVVNIVEYIHSFIISDVSQMELESLAGFYSVHERSKSPVMKKLYFKIHTAYILVCGHEQDK